ncbi:hypothetical protein HDU93_003634 [Gonapodya sp. JEL0774]|nr:hypothetical protein HDU93_003634 [Gonapodya sp. JEL0774]
MCSVAAYHRVVPQGPHDGDDMTDPRDSTIDITAVAYVSVPYPPEETRVSRTNRAKQKEQKYSASKPMKGSIVSKRSSGDLDERLSITGNSRKLEWRLPLMRSGSESEVAASSNESSAANQGDHLSDFDATDPSLTGRSSHHVELTHHPSSSLFLPPIGSSSSLVSSPMSPTSSSRSSHTATSKTFLHQKIHQRAQVAYHSQVSGVQVDISVDGTPLQDPKAQVSPDQSRDERRREPKGRRSKAPLRVHVGGTVDRHRAAGALVEIDVTGRNAWQEST